MVEMSLFNKKETLQNISKIIKKTVNIKDPENRRSELTQLYAQILRTPENRLDFEKSIDLFNSLLILNFYFSDSKKKLSIAKDCERILSLLKSREK